MAEPSEEADLFLDSDLLEPPPLPPGLKTSSFSLPSFPKVREKSETGASKTSSRPKKNFRDKLSRWSRDAGGYLPRILLLILVLLGILHLVLHPTDPECPGFFTWGAIVGAVIVCFCFLEDQSVFSIAMSVLVTIATWAITMAIAVIPSLMLLLMCMVSHNKDIKLSPHECGVSFGIIAGLFFLALVVTGAFMKYGFFRPAALFFLGFCLISPKMQVFCHDPFQLYTKVYSKKQEEPPEETPSKDLVSTASDTFMTLEDGTVQQILEEFVSRDPRKQRQAFMKLAQLEPIDEKRELVCRAVIYVLRNHPENGLWQDKTIDVLIAWQTSEVSDELVRLVQDAITEKQYERANLLARIPDPRITQTIVDSWKGCSAPLTNAIYTLGPRAEEPLWQYLSSDDRDVLVKTCVLLVQIGTEKSVPKLFALLENPDRFIVGIAESSIKRIQQKNK